MLLVQSLSKQEGLRCPAAMERAKAGEAAAKARIPTLSDQPSLVAIADQYPNLKADVSARTDAIAAAMERAKAGEAASIHHTIALGAAGGLEVGLKTYPQTLNYGNMKSS